MYQTATLPEELFSAQAGELYRSLYFWLGGFTASDFTRLLVRTLVILFIY
jgi:hypothetical protein